MDLKRNEKKFPQRREILLHKLWLILEQQVEKKTQISNTVLRIFHMRNQPECDEQKTKEKDLFETFYFALGNL